MVGLKIECLAGIEITLVPVQQMLHHGGGFSDTSLANDDGKSVGQ